MRFIPLPISLSMACLSVFGCVPEKNPYASRYGSGRIQATTSSEVASTASENDSTVPVTSPTPLPDTVTTNPTPTEPSEDWTKANSAISGIETICKNDPALANVQEELAVICLNGKPTDTFTNALAAPYKGGENPPLQVIKNFDDTAARVSEFMLLGVVEVSKPITEVFPKRASIVLGTLSSPTASVTQTIVSTVAGTGEKMGLFEINFLLKVQVGAISVDNTRILISDATALNPEKSVIAIVTSLKPNAPDNRDDILATTLSFYMQDGAGTKIISVSHQKSANRGRHATAETTALGLGRATMTNAYIKASQ